MEPDIFIWSISLETCARVAFWSIFVGFFGALGMALLGYVPRGRKTP